MRALNRDTKNVHPDGDGIVVLELGPDPKDRQNVRIAEQSGPRRFRIQCSEVDRLQ